MDPRGTWSSLCSSLRLQKILSAHMCAAKSEAPAALPALKMFVAGFAEGAKPQNEAPRPLWKNMSKQKISWAEKPPLK